MIDVTLLGTGGSIPLPHRYLSAAIIEYNGRKILMDCGEGTQVSMRAVNSGFHNLDVICITHLHGDHVIGLQGMLGTTSNSGRTEPITLIGPERLNDVLKGFRVISPYLNYDLNVIEDPDTSKKIFINNQHIHGEINIQSLHVKHTRPTLAYRVNLTRSPKFDVEKAKNNKVPQKIWGQLQKSSNETVCLDGQKYTSDMVLGSPRKGLSIAWVTDTLPIPEIVPFVKDVDLLISCANYGSDEDREKANRHRHMTFSDAATIAKNANVGTLLLTHFSQAMRHPEEYKENATSIFPNTIIGQDHLQLHLDYDKGVTSIESLDK